MKNITIFNQSNPQIGYVARTCTHGEEFDMVNFYIKAIVQKYSMLKRKRAAIFIEPQIDTGYPDIVIAEYYTSTLPEVNVARKRLSAKALLEIEVQLEENCILHRDAKYRLIISQRTSCLLLGPRNGVMHEQTFYDELLEWISTDRNQSAYFLHYFSLKETLEAAKSNDYSLRKAKANLK